MTQKSRNIEVSKFLKKGAMFVAIFIFMDLSLGWVASSLVDQQKTGKKFRIKYAIEEDESDFLILGSSHAMRHYIPSIFEDSLKLSTYNMGVQGQSLEFFYAMTKMRLKNHVPKKVLINLDERMFAVNSANESKLSDLHQHYWKNREILKPILSDHDPFIDFKMLFQSYRNNSSIGHVLKFFIKPENDKKGYLPLKGFIQKEKLESQKIKIQKKRLEGIEIDPKMLNFMEEIIADLKKNEIEIFMTISPSIDMANLPEDQSLIIAKEMAEKENIFVLDYLKDERFQLKYEWFKDFGHLNHIGAEAFSGIVVNDLMEINE